MINRIDNLGNRHILFFKIAPYCLNHIFGCEEFGGVCVDIFKPSAFPCHIHHFIVGIFFIKVFAYVLKQPHTHIVFKKTKASVYSALVGEIGFERILTEDGGEVFGSDKAPGSRGDINPVIAHRAGCNGACRIVGRSENNLRLKAEALKRADLCAGEGHLAENILFNSERVKYFAIPGLCFCVNKV